MRVKTTLVTVLSLIGVVAVGFTLGPSFAGDSPPAKYNAERPWLSIGQIHQKLEAAGYRNVEKIEREHGSYKVRASDRNGARVKLYVNPQTGEVIDRGQKPERASDDGRQNKTSSTTNCSKRRCRDDLPTSTGTASPVTK